MTGLWTDLRHAFRTALRKPLVSMTAIVTIAVGAGVNGSVFTLFSAALLHAPFPDPDRLLGIFNSYPTLDSAPASLPDFLEWRRQTRTLDGLAAYFPTRLNFQGGAQPERVLGSLVSEGYFRLMGITPEVGRVFSPQEHSEGAPPVCLISDSFWRKRFSARADIAGQPVAFNGVSYTITGVVPATAISFSYPEKTDVWIPLEPRAPYKVHGTNYLNVIGRLRPGASAAAARAELDTIQDAINREFPGNKHSLALRPLMQVLFGDTRQVLFILFLAAALVLLIACANLANLLLTAGAGRSGEFALRHALGADALELFKHAMAHSLLIASAGCVLGFALVPATCKLLMAMAPPDLRAPESIVWDWSIALYSLAVVVVVSLLAGIFPALRASQAGIGQALRTNSWQSTAPRKSAAASKYFVVAEIAFTTVLLAGASFMMESLWRLVRSNPGFNPDKLLILQISLGAKRYAEPAKQAEFFEQVLARMRTLPGVLSAGAITGLPISGNSTTGDFTIEGRPKPAAGQNIFARKEIVAPGYFEAMKIPLIAGRFFNEFDSAAGHKVVILSQSMAKEFWHGRNPIGSRLDLGLGQQNEWQEVIGIAGDVQTEGLGTPAMFAGYLCSKQYPSPAMSVVVRTAMDPASVINGARQAVTFIDRQQPVSRIVVMDQVLRDSLAVPRSVGYLIGALSGVALALAIVGVYGLLAYSVTQRNREIGVRMALGASPATVIYRVVKSGMKLTAAGLFLGTALFLAVVPLVRSRILGVGAEVTPVPLLFVAGVLGLTCFLASYIPARRAALIDPMQALKVS